MGYQNIFTQVQLAGPAEAGVPSRGSDARIQATTNNYWLGKVLHAQIGPIYLGPLGIASLICGFLAFEIIGLNMWASVGWDPVQFVRQLFWLALEPPPAKYGLSIPR
jgi:photosynthetic reaction center M subunit